ncbi:ABC transporter ATP-binding protein [Treponema denticola]|uniref:ABC transporter ATP-binding protein n=1 Tax=Treponema denticola TaxID=158 RepID=UPI0021F81CAE|nr:ABC transporter ATP-binding protein [Treponema denticola]UYT07588.1 ABC transporter ATP-binding protein [Treponema denticola]
MGTVLNVEKINITYRNKHKSVYAVKDISFMLNQGDSLGIVGESGSGKSTLAMGLLKLLPARSTAITGCVEFDKKNLLELTDRQYNELRWKEISVVFQKSMNALSPVHRISVQIEDIYRVHYPNTPSQKIKERALYLFSLVNLSSRVYNLYPHELSGGMLQRISIAISLLFSPKLLILDEATTALDTVTQGQILDEIVKLEAEMNMTRIMITHDISVVSQSCNKVGIMYAGELMEIGSTETVLKNPKHPYTKALIESFPSLYGEKKPLKSIEGFIPDLSQQYKGCIFAPRCKNAMDICKSHKPQKTEFKDGDVYCHLYKEAAK